MKTPLLLLALITAAAYSFAQKVGIGTTTPGYTLTVKDTTPAGVGIAQVLPGPGGQIEVGTAITGGEAYIQTHSSHNLNFTTGDFPGIPQVTIANENGYVGIGTSNPVARLDVSGNINVSGYVRLQAGAPGLGKVLVSDALGVGTWQSMPRSAKVMSISAAAFVSNQGSNLAFNLTDGACVGMNPGIANTMTMFAPVTLPDSAVITKVKVLYVNNTTAAVSLKLMRGSEFGSITTTAVTDLALTLPGTVIKVAQSSVLSHTVSNTRANYYITVNTTAANWPDISQFKITWVEITYTN